MERSYYGSLEEVSSKFRQSKGVHIYMLDQHITALVDKHIKRFQKEISILIDVFKTEVSALKSIKKDVLKLKEDVSAIQKQNKDDKEKEKLSKDDEKELGAIITNIEKKRKQKDLSHE